jgi:hypothetical protein
MAKMKAKRTTLYSRSGKKLYAKRDEKGTLQGHPELQARTHGRHAPQVEGQESEEEIVASRRRTSASLNADVSGGVGGWTVVASAAAIPMA